MRVLAAFIAIVGSILLAAPQTSAKGYLDRIELKTAGAAAIEVTDGDGLWKFNPWASAYIAGVVSDVPQLAPAIEVGLYADLSGDGAERIYTFTYAPALNSDGGYIYIPGPGDPDYRRNISTILSGPGPTWRNGAWHRASDEWVAFMSGLREIQPPSTGDAGLR